MQMSCFVAINLGFLYKREMSGKMQKWVGFI